MTLYMFDAAYKPNLATVKANGGIAVNGYLTGTYRTSTTQVSDAIAAGLGYVPTYEEGASELVGATRAQGRTVGDKILAAFAADKLPIDGSIAVYPSVDVTVAAGNVNSIDAGYLGLRDRLAGKISLRLYGEGALIDHVATAGLVDGKCWLAAPTSWPGYNPKDSNVCMVQEVGSPVGGTDRNHLITDPAAIGAYWPTNSPYGGNDMPLTTTEIKAVAAEVHAEMMPTLIRLAAYLAGKGENAEFGSAQGVPTPPTIALSAAEHARIDAAVAALQAAIGKVTPGTGTTAAQIAEQLQASVTITAKP